MNSVSVGNSLYRNYSSINNNSNVGGDLIFLKNDPKKSYDKVNKGFKDTNWNKNIESLKVTNRDN